MRQHKKNQEVSNIQFGKIIAAIRRQKEEKSYCAKEKKCSWKCSKRHSRQELHQRTRNQFRRCSWWQCQCGRRSLWQRSELIVSLVQASLGDTWTNMSVLAFPPKACWSKKVSLQLRNGTWLSLAERAMMTLPRFDRDLMWFFSVKRSPVALDSLRRSDPAKSTM